jgi:hypothetical protein
MPELLNTMREVALARHYPTLRAPPLQGLDVRELYGALVNNAERAGDAALHR